MINVWNNFIYWIQSLIEDRTFGAARSPLWEHARRQYLAAHPTCEACGSTKSLQIHHKQSFATTHGTDPSLELNQSNLITLCEGMERNCHRMIGHLGSYQSLNETVETDAAYWLKKIANRPTWDGTKWVYPIVV